MQTIERSTRGIKVRNKQKTFKLKRKALVCLASIAVCLSLLGVGVIAGADSIKSNVKNPINYSIDVVDESTGDVLRVKNGIILVGNAKELAFVSKKISEGANIGSSSIKYNQASYEVDANIDATGVTVSSMGSETYPFSGTFDGGTKTISNVTVADGGTALFGVTSGAIIKSIVLINVKVSSSSVAAGLVASAKNNTTINDVSLGGTVSGKTMVAGLVAEADNTCSISKVEFSGTINADNSATKVANIVASLYGTLENANAHGEIVLTSAGSSSTLAVGGVVATTGEKATIKNCFNNSAINAESVAIGTAGGVVAINLGKIQYSGNTVSVQTDATSAAVGGVAGQNSGEVLACFNAGKINGGSNVGGVVGKNTAVVNKCFSSASIVGAGNNVGGVVGYNSTSNSKIYNAYANGEVKTLASVVADASAATSGINYGGVAGANEGSVSSCYAICSVVGIKDAQAVIGANTGIYSNAYAYEGANVTENGVAVTTHTNATNTLTEAEMVGTTSTLLSGLNTADWTGTASTTPQLAVMKTATDFGTQKVYVQALSTQSTTIVKSLEVKITDTAIGGVYHYYVELGEYPQTVVEDTTTVAALNALGNSAKTGRTFVVGGSDDSAQTAHVEYAYNGAKYVKVASAVVYNNNSKFNSGTAPTGGKTYWFKVEPIKWFLLEAYSTTKSAYTGKTTNVRVISEKTLTANVIFKKDKGGNTWATSNIRAWLNDKFYNSAFASDEKVKILTNNTKYTTTGNYNQQDDYNATSNLSSCDDNVWLMSYYEAQNTFYQENYYLKAQTRKGIHTDFAVVNNLFLYPNIGYYWLRSAGSTNNYSCIINAAGERSYDWSVYGVYEGIRPLMTLSLLG